MIILGGLLIAAGLLVRFAFAPRDVLFLSSHTLGWLLVLLGVLLSIIGLVRRARREWARRTGSVPGLPGSGGPIARLRVLPHLISGLRRDTYPGAPRWQPLLWAAALVYLISPIDIIPELLPVIGVTDDAGVLLWLATSVFGETGRYVTWQRRGRAAAERNRSHPPGG